MNYIYYDSVSTLWPTDTLIRDLQYEQYLLRSNPMDVKIWSDK